MDYFLFNEQLISFLDMQKQDGLEMGNGSFLAVSDQCMQVALFEIRRGMQTIYEQLQPFIL
jgi:hypothetical protein